jgi:hypothetical protein
MLNRERNQCECLNEVEERRYVMEGEKDDVAREGELKSWLAPFGLVGAAVQVWRQLLYSES